jgi:hypothetical protein
MNARVLANNVVEDLKDWNPGVYHGRQVPAIAEILFSHMTYSGIIKMDLIL